MTYTRVYRQFVTLSYPRTTANTWWRRALKLFGLLPDFEFVASDSDRHHPRANVETVCRAYGIREHMCPGEAIYGVISYSHAGVLGFRVYGVHDGWRHLNPAEIRRYCHHRGLPVPDGGTD